MSDLIQLEKLPVETLAEMANEAAAACEASGRKTVEHAATAGRALLAAKAQVKHGEWGQWLADNFSQSHKRATQYMEIANLNRGSNLEEITSIRDALRMIAESPEKQAKKAEREARKAEVTPKPLAPATPAMPVTVGTIRHESPPAPQPQPERPAWLADPDELERPEADDVPQLPRTNTHHTADNRRQPDARETDRVGLVSPEDPRELHDGRLYVWRESANRLFLATPDEIWEAAMELRPDALVAHSGAPTPDPRATKKVVERDRGTTPVVQAKPGKVPTVAQLTEMLVQRSAPGNWPLNAVEMIGRWAAHKQSLTGKAKIRTEQQWETALSRMENVATLHGWHVVADMIEKAIANGWQGWEHQTDNGRKSGPVAPHRTYARLNKAEVKYDELPE